MVIKCNGVVATLNIRDIQNVVYQHGEHVTIMLNVLRILIAFLLCQELRWHGKQLCESYNSVKWGAHLMTHVLHEHVLCL